MQLFSSTEWVHKYRGHSQRIIDVILTNRLTFSRLYTAYVNDQGEEDLELLQVRKLWLPQRIYLSPSQKKNLRRNCARTSRFLPSDFFVDSQNLDSFIVAGGAGKLLRGK